MTATPTKNCEVCGIEFVKPVTCSRKNWELRSFCSKSCSNSRPSTAEGVVVEGIEHGTITGYSTYDCRCFDCRDAAKKYRQRSRAGILVPREELGRKDADHPQWMGDNVGYFGLHAWVAKNKTKTGICLHCREERVTQWANVDHQYKRDLNDFIELCCSCHKKYDLKHNLGRRAA